MNSKLFIPQHHVSFQGTVRSNIDPFGTVSDLDLWNALRRSWLFDSTEFEIVNGSGSLSGIKFYLDKAVDNDGSNFSLGEVNASYSHSPARLFVIPRYWFSTKPLRVLIFKPTSGFKRPLLPSSKHCTILCIAHRLRTILDYDRILVLEAGEVVEFDTSMCLYNTAESVFKSMCDNSGITLDDFTK